MLDGKHMRRDAIRAVERIGPPAADFAPVLFKELDAQEHMYSFEGAQALGSIGRDDPDVIDGLLRRLHSGTLVVRSRCSRGVAPCRPAARGPARDRTGPAFWRDPNARPRVRGGPGAGVGRP